MDSYSQTDKYTRAVERVKEIKGFYRHLTIFILINIALFVINTDILDFIARDRQDPDFRAWLNWNVWITPLLWGIGLTFHGLNVFLFKGNFLRKWEERKLQQFMEEEQESFDD